VGLYNDLQTDLAKAFDSDLSDAVIPISIVSETVSSYDPVLGQQVSTKTTVETRGVAIKDAFGQDPDDPLKVGFLSFLILDSEKKVDKFEIDMEVTVRDESYIIAGVSLDPASAAHTIVCRRAP